MKDIRQALKERRLFFDGGTGTILQERGLKGGELPERWNLTRPEEIERLHREYFEAGCDIVSTNTFGANALKYPGEVESVVKAGVAIAQKARTAAGREDAFIALDIGPTGRLLKPTGDLAFEDAVAIFAEEVKAGAAAGADLVVIETMSDLYEAKAAVLAAKENSELPVFVTMVFDRQGKLLTGASVEAAVAVLEGLRVDALGTNCGFGPSEMLPIAKRLTAAAHVPVIVNPNAGLPRSEGGRTVFDIGAEDFAEAMRPIAGTGAQLLGGCCGTTPAHIKAEIAACKGAEYIHFPKNEKLRRPVIASGEDAVTIGEKPLIVGERINPTGKKLFKEALRNRDIAYILRQAVEQEDGGAHILDVNVGLPEIDEPELMEEVVTRLMGVTSLPLQIDTSDPKALERALRIYNGKALINSVNGREEVMESVLPIVAKYGGVLIALPIDERGIPKTAKERVEIARRIMERAAEYGIAKEDIVVDGLAMAVSAENDAAKETLETIRLVRDELRGCSVLGVSNVSFGLPARELVNAAFLTMALQNGLSLAIINPNNAQMMHSYRSFMALTAQDPGFADYIAAYSGYKSAQAQAGGAKAKAAKDAGGLSLKESIVKGIAERAGEAAKEELREKEALSVINENIIPALDEVGKGFEAGTIFLPQLLLAAEAAQAAFASVKQSMQGAEGEKKGRVILATVKGDIHDIGKNIVKVMLENYGYEVLDLGRDVPPEKIVGTAKAEGIRLVGLSALMTTTVVSMEETIKLLRKEKPDTKVVVGGAVMTKEYAEAIGADRYAKDAMETVRYADEVFA